MNAHVCLAAKFGYLDMLKVLYMPKYIRRSILFWLVIFGTHFGTFKFYLWDLLPAIYLSYPELFQDRKGFIQSTLVDLEKGKLVFIDDNEGNLNMPSGIKNIKLFKDILFKGWRESINAIDQ
jgi:inosine-uridine nucleoside N-ribohydrolase